MPEPEARDKRKQRLAEEGQEAWNQYQSEAVATDERTAKLKEARLAREAEDKDGPPKKRAAAKKSAKRGVGSY